MHAHTDTKFFISYALSKISLAPNSASAWNYLRGYVPHFLIPVPGSIGRFYLDVHLPRSCIAYKNLFPQWITLKHRGIRMLTPQEKHLPWLWSGCSMHRWNHFVMVTTSQFCIMYVFRCTYVRSSPGFDMLIQPENVIGLTRKGCCRRVREIRQLWTSVGQVLWVCDVCGGCTYENWVTCYVDCHDYPEEEVVLAATPCKALGVCNSCTLYLHV